MLYNGVDGFARPPMHLLYLSTALLLQHGHKQQLTIAHTVNVSSKCKSVMMDFYNYVLTTAKRRGDYSNYE